MFQWKKLGKIFTPQEISGRAWLHAFAQAPCALVLDDVVRIYFSCRPPADDLGQFVSYSAFVDFDRNDLTTIRRVAEHPILPLGQLGTFDEFGIYPLSVVRDGKQIRAYYGGWTRCESVPFNVGIGVAISEDDGVSFRKLGNGPVLPYSLDEPFILSGPKIRKYQGDWLLFYICGTQWKKIDGRMEPIYRIRAARSKDGLRWEKFGRDLIPPRFGDNEAQASPDVFFHSGRFHMFFCYRSCRDYRSGPNAYRIGYAYSADLLNWTRSDEKAGIDVSETGWDSEMVSYPHVFAVDDRIYMAYLGNHFGRDGFGLASLEGTLE